MPYEETTEKIYKYRLGWKFTESDERLADLAIRRSNEYMKTYGKGGLQPYLLNHARYIHAPLPDEETDPEE